MKTRRFEVANPRPAELNVLGPHDVVPNRCDVVRTPPLHVDLSDMEQD